MSLLKDNEIEWVKDIESLSREDYLLLPEHVKNRFASLVIEYRQHGLREVMRRCEDEFARTGKFKLVWLSGGKGYRYGGYVFFCTEKDLKESVDNGLREKILEFIREQIALCNTAVPIDFQLELDWSSDEFVRKNFSGNYHEFLR